MTNYSLRLQISSLQDAIDATGPIIPLSVIHKHCAVNSNFDPALMSVYLKSVIEWAEKETRRTIVARSHRWVVSGLSGEVLLPRGKTQSVDGISYVYGGESFQLTGPDASPAGDDWQQDLTGEDGGLILFPTGGSWPSVDSSVLAPAVISFTAGWRPEQIPADIVHALLFAISDAIEFRGEADFPSDLTNIGRNSRIRESLLDVYRLKFVY